MGKMSEQKMLEPVDTELSLRYLVFYVLKKWRLLLLALLVCAAAVFLVSYAQSALLPDAGESGQTLAEYEHSIEMLEYEVTALEAALENQRDYNRNSLLMQMDPQNKLVSVLTYYIVSEMTPQPETVQVQTGLTGSLLKRYVLYMTGGDLYADILQQFPTIQDVRYLREILTVAEDPSAAMITITVIGDDSQMEQRMLDVVRDGMAAVYTGASALIGGHTLTEIDSSAYRENDTALADMQQQSRDQLLFLESEFSDKKQMLAAIREEAAGLESAMARNATVGQWLKTALLGGCAGLVVAVLLLSLYYIVSDKVLTIDKIHPGICILGEIPPARIRRRWLMDRAAAVVGGVRLKAAGREAILSLTAQNIHSAVLAKGIQAGSIALAGSITVKELRGLAEHFNEVTVDAQLRFAAAGNPLQDAASVELINSSVATVIVEKLEVSMSSDILKETARITAWGKPVLGIVLLNADAM